MARKTEEATDQPSERSSQLDAVLRQIEDALRGMQFGQLTVIVHDGRVIQMERTERTRLQPLHRK